MLFCDSDALLKKICLEKMKLVLDNNPNKSYVYCRFKYGFKTFPSFDFDAEKLKQFNYINIASLIRREHFPGFDENFKKFQDWDLWLTMLEQGHTGVLIKEVLLQYHIWNNGISTWLPKVAYKIPWKKFGISIKTLEKYEHWKALIYKKHNFG